MDATVLGIVQQAMLEIGLPKPNEAVTSSDLTVQQFVALFNSAGNEMVVGNNWNKLVKEYTITTVADQDSYLLPTDYSSYIDQTIWDRTNHWPVIGVKSSQEWEQLKGGLLSSGPRTRFRINNGKFNIFPTPGVSGGTVGAVIAMEYVGTGWLQDSQKTNTYYSLAKSDSDISLFDEWLIVKFLKLKYLEAKGLDTSAAAKDFNNVWQARQGQDKGGDILSLSPRRGGMLLGFGNIPDGSWNVGS